MNIIDKASTWILSKASNLYVFNEYHKRSIGKKIDYTRQASNMSRKEIRDWSNAIMAATDPDNPRLGGWLRFRQNMSLDGHLMSCIENRIMPVQCAPFKLVDSDNNEDIQAKKLLERPWYLEIAKHILSYTFDGVKLIEMYDINEKGELARVSEIPQSNFIPQKGIIIDKEYDTEGTSYKEGVYKNYYFQVGGDWELGILSGLATVVIAKKLGLGSWMSYIDKFGVPPIFAITDRMDSTRRDELFEMLENFRMNHFAVLQGNEKIETPQGYNVDAHNTFKSLMSDICDKEISKRILGSSGLTDEKSFVGAAEVQERILQYRYKVDKLIFKYYFNSEVMPRLVKLSPVYAPLANLTFEYDESETLSMKEVLEAVGTLSQYFEFNVEELVKITGLPITKLKAAIGQVPPEPEDPKTDDTQKKKSKVNSFSSLAPYAWMAPPLEGVGLIYAATWDNAINDLIEQIRRGEIKPEELNKDFILKTYDRLNKAAQNGYGKDYYTDEIARKIRENLLRFSATKTHVQQNEVQTLSDSIDSKKLYEQEAKKYLDLQNGQYLNVQAAWSARSAQAARQFQDWILDKDIYQRVKFRTMNDKDVRPAHFALEGMVVDIDDPFLDEHMTPLDPNCRCWWEQTREVLTNFTPDYTPDPQWSGNPGKTGEIFNDNNSYNEKVESKEVRLEIRKQAELTKAYLPYNKVMKSGDNNVYINDFADVSDLEQNIEAARKLAKEMGKDIFIRHHIEGGIVNGQKNPELAIGKSKMLGDLKTFDGESSFVNFIKNRLKSANKQGAHYAILDLSKQNDFSELKRLLAGSLGTQNTNIQRVVIINGDKVAEITRKQITSGDFSALEKIKENEQ
ncbi:DUF935 family protein [Dysgonomonas sp. ZJ279]|uniref:phage portal protein family protein n=1 Tax=Dysgonomonas sp. ZJ279 TaxID=2709796 RepID=UPI0013E9B21D|nr:DUF935 family protein [Dysgonomonas sp. ZJ279]